MELEQVNNLSVAPLLNSAPEFQDPAEIILLRRQVRRSFTKWCEYRMSKEGRTLAAHHRLITSSIEKLLHNELPTRKLMLLMPPGSAKSTYTSVLLPSWFLNPEQHPTDLMLACSYSYELIEGFGGRARDIVDRERNLLGISISRKYGAAGDWRTNRDGGFFCGGVNAGIAGHRAGLGLVDDYIGNEEQAMSQLVRDKNWDWYWNDFYPRLVPEAFQIIIANRRHEDDMVGRHLNEPNHGWTVLRLPMLAEDDDPLGRNPGDILWPEWFTHEMIEPVKKFPRTWAGLYQQRPAPEEGNYFRREDILTYKLNELPTNLRIYCGSDWALRSRDVNDRTCHLVGGVDQNNRLWILPDWFWDRCDTLTATNKMFEMAERHHPICWWHGRENITGSIGPFVYQKMRDENKFVPIEEFPESKDKEAKAQPIRSRMMAKCVLFPGFHPDWEKVLNELLTFPLGVNDDYVDALAKLGQGLDKMTRPSKEILPWDGVIPELRLTCGWVQRSAKLRERETESKKWDN